MLTPSKKLFYAVEAVLFIAYNAKVGPISGSEVAAQQGLPARYLEPLMQKLVKAGILRGVRGPQGGYVLGRERRRIALKDICDVVQGERALPSARTSLGKQVLAPETELLLHRWNEGLAETTIAALCDCAAAKHVKAAYDTATDFAI